MNDSTIRLSADTSALTDSLSKIAEEMTAMKDAVSSSATAMGANLDASAKQAEATNAAIHGLDESVKTVTDSIEAQTKTVTDLGTKQSKVTKEISKALETQNSQQKDANTTLAEQKKIMQEQEAEIKKVTKAVDNQTGVLQKNASGWKMLMTGFAIKFASEIVDGFKSIISTGLEASRVYEDMSARLTPLVGDLETAQKTFWSLNGLEDETATATDKLAKAFVDLGNNGLTNSNEQLKTYATIAHGTGRDINTLTDAVIAFSQGSTKALRQFGITAKDNGDTIPSGCSGGKTVTEDEANTTEALCEILELSSDGAGHVTLKFDSCDLTVPAFPDTVEPSQPYTKITATANHLAGSVFQPMPADYPFEDNGLYEILDYTNGVYTVKRLNDSYGEVSDWHSFYSTGVNQEHVLFTLVSGQASDGGYVGPYRACPYGAESKIFELDFSMPGGLGKLNDDGEFDKLSISIQIEYRRAGSNEPYTVIEKSWTNNTNDQLAETVRIELETAGNYEFRVLRTSQEDGSTRALEEIKWVGLKSVTSTIDRYDNMTVLICRFKGNETLSELSENQLATYWTRKLPALGYSDNQPLVATRDIAPVVQYIVRNSKYRNILDVDTLMDFDELWRSQGLECNGSIDSDSTLLESLRDVLNCGFAVPVVRDNTLSVKRLYAGATPTQIFTKSNMTSSPVITYSLPKEDDVNEVVVNFTSPKTYKTETVYCHVDADGNKHITSYPESDNQEQLDAWGVTDYDHAVALGMRRLRYLRNTRVTYEIKTELNGLNCQFNDLVGLMLDENLSNITGRITGINGQTVTTDIEIPEDCWEGIVYISRKDGSYGEYTFYRNDSHTLYLDTYPDIDWDSEFGKSLEYPLFAIGELQLCWVTAVKPESGNRCSLKLINYSEDIFKDDIKENNS